MIADRIAAAIGDIAVRSNPCSARGYSPSSDLMFLAQLGRSPKTGSAHAAAAHPQMVETWSAFCMTAIKKIVPDEVLNELAELAAIPPGIGLWQPHEQFVFNVLKCIRMVHDYGNILDASKLKRLKEIIMRTNWPNT
jgi:hypothetical protein